MKKYKKGQLVKATVTGIENYGIFVLFDAKYSGLIHIYEISHRFVSHVNKFDKIGDTILVEVLEFDDVTEQFKLSIKNINYRKLSKPRKRKIKETRLGFETLAYNLPIWIEKSVKKIKKVSNSIDK